MPNGMAIFRRKPPLTGALNAGGVGKKRDSKQIPGFAAVRSTVLSTVRVTTNGGDRRAHRGVRRSLFAQEDDEVFVTGSTLYAETKGGQTPPDTTPLVITPFSAAVGHRRTEPGGYFC